MFKQTASLWFKLSHLGANIRDYRENRRVILTNQIGILGFIIPQLYNLFYVFYDLNLLWLPIIINIIGSCICLSVLYLNWKNLRILPKLVITISPNVQIFILTYYLGTATGMYLLHIMMISFVFFLFSNERRNTLLISCILPVVFYLYSYAFFTPERSPIILSAPVLTFLYITISLTVFILVMAFFILFYKEISYTENLLEKEYERSEKLLLNILPKEIAMQLKENPKRLAETYPSVTILFADIVGFTGIASTAPADELVEELNNIFSAFDHLADRYELEKIKTIGDAYMVAGGIPVPVPDHAERVARMSLDMLDEIKKFSILGNKLNIRIGFHTGPVVAGVIGVRKFSYDIWGDAVNIASRLESHGASGKVHVSKQVYEILKDKFDFKARGKIQVKGIGEIETYFLTGERESS